MFFLLLGRRHHKFSEKEGLLRVRKLARVDAWRLCWRCASPIRKTRLRESNPPSSLVNFVPGLAARISQHMFFWCVRQNSGTGHSHSAYTILCVYCWNASNVPTWKNICMKQACARIERTPFSWNVKEYNGIANVSHWNLLLISEADSIKLNTALLLDYKQHDANQNTNIQESQKAQCFQK